MALEATATMLDAALELLGREFSVIPCHSPDMALADVPDHVRKRVDPSSPDYSEKDVGKVPILVEWGPYIIKRPTEKEVRTWWERWPTANVAIVCGPVSKVFAMDADGEQGMQVLAKRGIWLGMTLTSQTGRTKNSRGEPDSGYHMLFRHPGDKIKTNVRVAPDLDIKADGGYVVAPPSLHASLRRYEWLDADTPIALAPEWLLEFVRKQNAPTGARLTDDEIERVLKGSKSGQQHNDYLKIAAHWIGMGVPRREVEQMTVAWAATCTPPADVTHLLKELGWVWEAEQKKQKSADDMKTDRIGDDFRFSWPGLGIQIDLRSLHSERGGTQGTIDVSSTTSGNLHFGRIVLESTSAREELFRKLSRVRNDINWTAFLERVCRDAATEFERGEDFRWLVPSPAPAAKDFFQRFIPSKETTVLFADGGVGKSSIALALAIANALGEPVLPGWTPALLPMQKGLTIFLDWESTHEEHEDRLAALAKTHFGVDYDRIRQKIGYLRMRGPIWDQVPMLRARLSEMVEHHLEQLENMMVITDSYGPAAGPDPVSEDAANRTLSALHALGPATRLLISHITKAASEMEEGAKKPIGSVYVYDRARCVWEMRKLGDPMSSGHIVRLDHRKANRGKLQKTFAIKILYEEDGQEQTVGIGLHGERMNEESPLALVLTCFRTNPGPFTVKQIADMTGLKEDTARRKILERFRNLFKVVGQARTGQAGKPSDQWALVDTVHEAPPPVGDTPPATVEQL